MHKKNEQTAQIRQVTILGAAMNTLLSVMKITVGMLLGSAAMITDGFHSMSDLITDAAVIIGLRLSERLPDEKHPYGHKWYETFTTCVISALLAATGAAAIYKSAAASGDISGKMGFSVLLATAAASIAVKEWLYVKTRKVAQDTNCSPLYANAWHHRSDAFSSVAVLAGLTAQMVGFEYGDRAAAIIVGTLIIAAGLKLFTGAMGDFTNAAIDTKTIQLVESVVQANPAIRQMHKLRSRSIGREIFLDFHILVDERLNVADAHGISMDVEKQISDVLKLPVNIIIHIEPDKPAFRK